MPGQMTSMRVAVSCWGQIQDGNLLSVRSANPSLRKRWPHTGSLQSIFYHEYICIWTEFALNIILRDTIDVKSASDYIIHKNSPPSVKRMLLSFFLTIIVWLTRARFETSNYPRRPWDRYTAPNSKCIGAEHPPPPPKKKKIIKNS